MHKRRQISHLIIIHQNFSSFGRKFLGKRNFSRGTFGTFFQEAMFTLGNSANSTGFSSGTKNGNQIVQFIKFSVSVFSLFSFNWK